jgi:hypothetical protein
MNLLTLGIMREQLQTLSGLTDSLIKIGRTYSLGLQVLKRKERENLEVRQFGNTYIYKYQKSSISGALKT